MNEEVMSGDRDLKAEYALWESRVPTTERPEPVTPNTSGVTPKLLYTPLDVTPDNYLENVGFPGTFPFTRGIHASMYRGRLWTSRQIAGFGRAHETNERYRFLLAQGMTGLSTDFDHPTLVGHDSDDDEAIGEVGRIGVAIDSIDDMDELLRDIPLDRTSLSMTINHPAPILLAMLIAVAERRGLAPSALNGTTQNDPLKEFYAQKTFVFDPKSSMRILADTVEYAVQHLPQWKAVSVCGGHAREAGANAVQELAFTLADGIAYMQAVLDRGLTADEAAPAFSFLMNSHMDFFEEIAKLRAARRMWATIMRDRFKAAAADSWRFRVHTQTGCDTFTAQQPENNIVRGTIQALAGVLGGTQSMHVNGMDEALSIPSEHAMQVALRTQQIIAHESGVANTVDPLAGSYFVESLTDELESQAWDLIRLIDDHGGMLEAVESGLIEQMIADEAYRFQQSIQARERITVGVNAYVVADEALQFETFRTDPRSEAEQVKHVRNFKQSRDVHQVHSALDKVRSAAASDKNVMPLVVEAVKARATEGEIIAAMKDVFGEYKPPVIY